MGMFDRALDRALRKRAQEITVQNGRGTSAFGRIDLRGLSGNGAASAIGDMAKMRPSRDEASTASAAAARAVDLIVQQASARRLQVTTATGEPVDHYLETLFNISPNDSTSGLLFRQTIWHRLIHHGQAFIILDRGPSRVDDPKSAHVHFGSIGVALTDPTAIAPHGEILAYKVSVGDETVILAPSEVLWLRFPEPGNPWGARAPISAALDAIGLSRAARAWQAGQLANGGNPQGYVWTAANNEDDHYAIAAEIDAALNGPSSAGRIAYVSNEVKPEFTRTSFTAAEVGYQETLANAGNEIALALGVPVELIGGQAGNSLSREALTAAWQILWEGTILPRLEIVASEINRQLLADTDYLASFDVSDVTALQEGQDAIAARIAKALELDVLTIDEGRAVFGYDPLPDGAGAVSRTEYIAQINAATAATAARATAEPIKVRFDVDAAELETAKAVLETQEIQNEEPEQPAAAIVFVPENIISAARNLMGTLTVPDSIHALDAISNGTYDNNALRVVAEIELTEEETGVDRYQATELRAWAEAELGLEQRARTINPKHTVRDLDRLEATAIKAIKRLAEAQRRETKKRLQRGQRDNTVPASLDGIFNEASWLERAYEYILPAIQAALDKGAESAMTALNVDLYIDNALNTAAEERAQVVAELVNSTTQTIINDKLTSAAVADRISVKEFANILDAAFDDLASYRAETIARTEMVGGFNSGSRSAALKSGITTAREWVATLGDGRTRPAHYNRHGVRTRSMDDPYPNTSLMYPGDPAGGAHESINCRCVEIYIAGGTSTLINGTEA